jgi:c-di-GMP-binding flagellar brake protein YcgR
MTPMSEKRKYPRLDINVKVNWKKTAEPKPEDAESRDITRNISAGGICLMVYEKLDVGDCLSLDLELPSGKELHLVGRVVWTKEFEIIGKKESKRYDIGLEFLDIKAGEREEIKNFVFSFLDAH